MWSSFHLSCGHISAFPHHLANSRLPFLLVTAPNSLTLRLAVGMLHSAVFVQVNVFCQNEKQLDGTGTESAYPCDTLKSHKHVWEAKVQNMPRYK